MRQSERSRTPTVDVREARFDDRGLSITGRIGQFALELYHFRTIGPA
jgi:hypothetical protein